MTISDTLPVVSTADESFADNLRHSGMITWFQRGDTISRESEDVDYVHLVASGFVVAVKRTIDGQQQNVALYLPGDIVGHEIFSLGALRYDSVALTPVTSHRVSLAALREVLERDRTHANAFWRHVAFHGALAHEWLLSLGRRPAYARTAHLLCEIIHRSGLRGDGDTGSCPMPLTQTELADTLGLSVVHVNRTLMRLRDEGLIRLRRGHIDVLNWQRFKAAAGFEPDYLSIKA